MRGGDSKIKKYAIGIDRGGTTTRIVIGDKNGFLTKPKIVPTSEKVETLIELIKKEIKKAKIKPKEIKAIGIGTAGIVDLEKKELMVSANAPAISFKPIEEELKIPVKIENDCNTAVMGEKLYGEGKNIKNLIHITIGTGIGAGIYYQGRLLKSSKKGRAGEVGFLIIDCEGRCETFGKKGVWEAYCSGKNIPNFVRMLLKEEKRKTQLKEIRNLKAKDLFRLAKKGDKVAREYVDKIARLNAMGFGSIINVFNPQLITVGGSVVLKNPELLELIKKYIGEYIVNPMPEIKITKLGSEIGLYGALALAFE